VFQRVEALLREAIDSPNPLVGSRDGRTATSGLSMTSRYAGSESLEAKAKAVESVKLPAYTPSKGTLRGPLGTAMGM
jgi:hypothetical protein